ncbi:flavin reductase family protein [Oceanobacillus massiliensis]|uniref:flavin reductase family protein n=2 Tax=Oceanobacillus massiliensis TaxID=1465765 RepID=UPI000287A8C9|nr:flavin reductase family protein [Oceanobacillus massiliensis]
MDVDIRELETKEAYKLMTGSVIPRPIAWVSTANANGGFNLAPFSFFTVASRKPPMLCISIGPGVGEREGTVKDTLVNIREKQEFCINIVSSELGNPMQKSSENVGSDVDEFQLAGLKTAPSKKIDTPRIKEAPIAFELKLHQILELGTDHLIIGEIIHYHIKEDYYLGNYKVDIEKLKPLGRFAGGRYSELTELFTLPK